MSRRHRQNPLKHRAVAAFHDAAVRRFGRASVHDVEWLGEGLSRLSWSCTVETANTTVKWVAQVPRPHIPIVEQARLARELSLLTALSAMELPFRVPSPVTTVHVENSLVNITTFCGGRDLDMTGKIQSAEEVSRLIGHIAAAVHAIPPAGLPFPDSVYATRREDAEADLETLSWIDAPFVADVRDWCVDHLPHPDEPSSVVHGDLLGQNILWRPEDPPALLDWEYSGTGDPACDLAIVTRGKRKVFGHENGREMLLDAYNERAKKPLTLAEVRLRELTLVAGEVATFLEQYPHATEQLARLRNVFLDARKL